MRVLKFIAVSINPFRIYLVGMLAAIVITSIDANLKPYLIKLLIDKGASSNTEGIIPIVLLFAASQILMTGGWSFSDWCITQYYAKFRCHIMNILTDRLSLYSYSFFQNQLSGAIVAKISDAFNLIPTLIFTTSYQFIQPAVIAIIALFLLAQVHYLFSLGLLIWLALFLLITVIGMKTVHYLSADYAEAKSNLWGNLADYFGNILNVRCFSNKIHEIKRLEDVQQDFIIKIRRHGVFLTKFYIIQGIMVSAYIIGCLVVLLYLRSENLVMPGDFALVFMLNFTIIDKFYELSHKLRDFVSDWATVDQALKILDLPLDIQDKADAKPLTIYKGEIVFENVRFHYGDGKILFQNKSIMIAARQKIGLVGYSGGGKSTFVNLILRLFEVTGGRILIDGQDIRDVTQDSLRAAIAMIPQDPSLFHRTLMENIRYGRPDAADDDVMTAAKKAHAHEFIARLKQGYASLVGERGVKLSGGQRQRVAIARAILKDAPILIFDEATSQLDSVTESYIQTSLEDLMQNKTTIVIAHRLSTLLHMDRILVFDQGKIIEDGTHKALLARGGLYKTLWEAQVGGFLPESRETELS